jgi:hypothetical protein
MFLHCDTVYGNLENYLNFEETISISLPPVLSSFSMILQEDSKEKGCIMASSHLRVVLKLRVEPMTGKCRIEKRIVYTLPTKECLGWRSLGRRNGFTLSLESQGQSKKSICYSHFSFILSLM